MEISLIVQAIAIVLDCLPELEIKNNVEGMVGFLLQDKGHLSCIWLGNFSLSGKFS